MSQEFSSNTPPAWLIEPKAFNGLIEHSQSYLEDFNDCMDLEDNRITLTLYKVLNSFSIGKRELTPSVSNCTLLFALVGPGGLANVNIINVYKALSLVCNVEEAVQFYQGANTKFIGVSFPNAKEVAKAYRSFLYYDNCVVAYIKYASIRKNPFRLLWLLPMFGAQKVQFLLNKYCSTFASDKEYQRVTETKNLETTVAKGTLTPKQPYTLESLPHLIKLPFPHRGCALLLIEGHQGICLKCHQIGHVRKGCTIEKCPQCRQFHQAGTACIRGSYSDRLKGKFISNASDDWPQDVDEPVGPLAFSGGVRESFPIHIEGPPIVKDLNTFPELDEAQGLAQLNIRRRDFNAFRSLLTDDTVHSDGSDAFSSTAEESDHTDLAPPLILTPFPSSVRSEATLPISFIPKVVDKDNSTNIISKEDVFQDCITTGDGGVDVSLITNQTASSDVSDGGDSSLILKDAVDLIDHVSLVEDEWPMAIGYPAKVSSKRKSPEELSQGDTDNGADEVRDESRVTRARSWSRIRLANKISGASKILRSRDKSK